MLIAGDVGGTKIRLALFTGTGTAIEWTSVERFESRSVPSFPKLVADFLSNHQAKIDAACFGVPGPVIDGIVKVTNLPWTLSEDELKQSLGISAVKLVNDLVATASSVPYLSQENIETLYAGKPTADAKTAVVLAPGTGLGQAFVHFDDGRVRAYASEGGHADFAPTSERESLLFNYLREKFGRVSYERVLCGRGIVNIYEFLRDTKWAPESDHIIGRMRSEDPAAVISQAALKREDKLCEEAINLFCSILGAQAGNLALTLLATKGIYLGGGIPPKLLAKLKDRYFLESYLDKAPLSHIVECTPVHVIRDDRAAVIGAAHIADAL